MWKALFGEMVLFIPPGIVQVEGAAMEEGF